MLHAPHPGSSASEAAACCPPPPPRAPSSAAAGARGASRCTGRPRAGRPASSSVLLSLLESRSMTSTTLRFLACGCGCGVPCCCGCRCCSTVRGAAGAGLGCCGRRAAWGCAEAAVAVGRFTGLSSYSGTNRCRGRCGGRFWCACHCCEYVGAAPGCAAGLRCMGGTAPPFGAAADAAGGACAPCAAVAASPGLPCDGACCCAAAGGAPAGCCPGAEPVLAALRDSCMQFEMLSAIIRGSEIAKAASWQHASAHPGGIHGGWRCKAGLLGATLHAAGASSGLRRHIRGLLGAREALLGALGCGLQDLADGGRLPWGLPFGAGPGRGHLLLRGLLLPGRLRHSTLASVVHASLLVGKQRAQQLQRHAWAGGAPLSELEEESSTGSS